MSEDKKYVIDTNSLINNPYIILDKDVVVTSLVLRELEKLELRRNDRTLQYSIRVAKRMVEDNLNNKKIEIKDIDNGGVLEGYAEDYVDNKLVKYAIENGYGIITDDILLKHKAVSVGIEVIKSSDQSSKDYSGVVDFMYDDTNEEHIELMEKIQTAVTSGIDMYFNPFDMSPNEYLIIWDENKPTYKINDNEEKVMSGYKELGLYKFDGVKINRIYPKSLRTDFLGMVSPLNTRQRLAFDLLQDDEITVKALFGVFGSGKDYLMLSHAIQAVKEGKFDKIVWVRNNIEVKDTNSIGFLPDGLNDKLKPFLAPLQDFLGGEHGLELFMDEGRIEVQHLGFIRGRDIKNSIIYVTECQSNTKEHIQLLLGRVGEGSQIWFNGDDQQTDSDKFKTNNGVNTLKKLSGNRLYGQVTMDKTERSKTARLAGLLDEL